MRQKLLIVNALLAVSSNALAHQQGTELNAAVLRAETLLAQGDENRPDSVVAITKATPIFGRNYTHRYKVTIAKSLGTGTAYTNASCVVIGVDTSMNANVRAESCDDADEPAVD